MFLKTIPAIILVFIVGGLVGYALSTSQALTAAAAVADAVPIPEADQVNMTAPTPIPPCLPPTDIATNPGFPGTPAQASTTRPPTAEATRSPIEGPQRDSSFLRTAPLWTADYRRAHSAHHGTL